MADTVRTLSALQTLLANNTSGDISAQDLRDSVLSAMVASDPVQKNVTYTDAGLSDEFLTGTLDAQWTASNISANTVSLLTANPAASYYDLATRPGHLLVQPDVSGLNQSIRADAVPGDGEEIIVAMSMASPGDNPNVDNSLWCGIGLNDNDSAWDAGTAQSLFWDGADNQRVLWGAAGASGSSLIFNPSSGWIFFRIVRSGSTVFAFMSKNLQSWTPVGTGISMGSSNNFWVFWSSESVAFDHAPIIDVAWVRHTTYAGIDPAWLYRQGLKS